MVKRVLGTKDILPEEIGLWQEIEQQSSRVFSLYGYAEIRTPIIEDSALFNRSLGDSTEIVQKQMFEIKRDKETYVLRPEATASIVRAYIEENLHKKSDFTKLYYIGPMFRAERPQKGRLRQFHQIGCEAIGSLSAYVDAEVISLADRLLKELGIGEFEIKINNLGCPADKKRLAEMLKEDLKDSLRSLCEDCQGRYERNVFRILDCKNEDCRKVVEKLKLGHAHLCKDCSEHFEMTKKALDELGVSYTIVPHLVRGLDYYTRTVFEISAKGLGSQDAIGAGGRYDHLIKQMGGEEIPAIGFALGVERLLLAKSATGSAQSVKRELTYIITLGAAAEHQGFVLLDTLRKNGIAAEMNYQQKSMKAQMRCADSLLSRFVAILGDNEIAKGVVAVKDLETGEQTEIGITHLVEHLKKGLK